MKELCVCRNNTQIQTVQELEVNTTYHEEHHEETHLMQTHRQGHAGHRPSNNQVTQQHCHV